MTKDEFKNLVINNLVVLDGATGTELSKRGMPKGTSPEKWIYDNPRVLMELQKEYCEAGSSIIYTPTFGANKIKLREFGLEAEHDAINKTLAAMTKKACGKSFAFGGLAPTGEFIEPFGPLALEEAINIYKEQVQALIEGGVDGFVIETMMDLQEMRAAVIAIKETCDLPVMASMTYEKSGLTLNGTDPLSALVTLESLGVDAVGCNCSTGPGDMVAIVEKMKQYATVPIFAKPNAGMPVLKDGKTYFSMDAVEFSSFVPLFIKAGVNLFGGCCGTDPEYIKMVVAAARNHAITVPGKKSMLGTVSSSRKTVFFGSSQPVVVIGERINPSGKDEMQGELRAGKVSKIKEFALKQASNGADILDVNMGVSGISELEMMRKAIGMIAQSVAAPVSIDTVDPAVMESAIRLYPGKAIINSISARKESLEKMLPIAKKYGSMIIIMPVTDEGIPATFTERKATIEYIIQQAESLGIRKSDMLVDALVLTIGSDISSIAVTLDVIEWCAREGGVNSVCGISNLTYGLPNRKWLNSTMLAMAVSRGLSATFADPDCEEMMAMIAASDALSGRDVKLLRYIDKFSGQKEEKKENKNELTMEELIFEAVLKGDEEKIAHYIQKALEQGAKPNDLVDNRLIPAITLVGDKFDKKEYFLPQLIMSADTMRKGFDALEPYLSFDEKETRNIKGPTVVIATVQGDIHDIGKNIVALMLKNYSFNVIDLGKDVSAEDIIRVAKNQNAHLIGLSALMTTTMVEMKEVIELAKKEHLDVKFMIGGAVVDQNYADEIGADGYARDAMEAVRLAKNLSKKK